MRGRRENVGVVENYTNAFLVGAFCLLFMGLIAIWAIWGFLISLCLSYLADRVMMFRTRRH